MVVVMVLVGLKIFLVVWWWWKFWTQIANFLQFFLIPLQHWDPVSRVQRQIVVENLLSFLPSVDSHFHRNPPSRHDFVFSPAQRNKSLNAFLAWKAETEATMSFFMTVMLLSHFTLHRKWLFPIANSGGNDDEWKPQTEIENTAKEYFQHGFHWYTLSFYICLSYLFIARIVLKSPQNHYENACVSKELHAWGKKYNTLASLLLSLHTEDGNTCIRVCPGEKSESWLVHGWY